MYAKLENGVLIQAPKKLEIREDDKPITIFNPTDDILAQHGYKPVEYGAVPDSQFGYDTTYIETDTCIKVCYTALPISADWIRSERESVCFPIVNRGKPWYDSLTAMQRIEIENWYKAWLDAPANLTVPDKPEWLKEE